MPAGASAFAFTDGLALDTYTLDVRIGDGPLQTQWVVGGRWRARIGL